MQHRILSTWLRNRAENATDGRIPDQTRAQIAAVESAERAFRHEIGPVRATMQSVMFAMEDVVRADAAVEVHRRWLAANPNEPRFVEALIAATTEATGASDWLSDCLERHRQALRQALSDAVQTAGQNGGRAA